MVDHREKDSADFWLNYLEDFIYFIYFIFFLTMTDFTQEIAHLQKLCCISLSPQQEQKLWAQLTEIIGFLWKLPETKVKSEKWKVESEGRLALRTIAGVKENSDNKKILKNVRHEIVNNSIVIKSVLS